MLYYFVILTTLGFAIGMNDYNNKLSKIIAGGRATTIDDFPYQVSIQILDRGYLAHICGGSLLKLDIVLTAAHCMSLPRNRYIVRAGSTFISNGGQLRALLGYVNHPQYRAGYGDYDISILKLRQFDKDPAVRTIQVSRNPNIPIGAVATVSGWGKMTEEGDISEQLRSVNLQKRKLQLCQNNFPRTKITSRMTCYGSNKGAKDACGGDSGGPLVIGYSNRRYQVGIVSWGGECDGQNRPGVYTDLTNRAIQRFIFKYI